MSFYSIDGKAIFWNKAQTSGVRCFVQFGYGGYNTRVYFKQVNLMSSVVNKNAAITAQNESNSSTKSSLRKWAERSLMLMAVLGTVIVCMLYGDLITRYINPPISKSIIYGRWVEQDVAPYSREEFVLSERGVTVNGSTIATDFEFDGDSFSYKVGSTVRHFDFVGKQHTEMKLDARAHYLPVFRLEGHAGIAVR